MSSLSFGEYIKRSRKSRDMTQDQIASLAGTTKGHISKIEKGTREPTLGLAIRLCDAIGVDINEYVALIKEPTLR